jgi:ABC-type nitrate/sulfonate/bicarbonate transport system substrate-binding protein
VTANHAGLYAAHEGGLFEREGLDVELVNLGAGTPAQAALLSGELMVASVSGASTVNAVLAGGDLAFIGAVFDTMPYQMAAVREISSMADLRGKTIGINRLGGTPHWVVRYLLRQAGLDPEADARLIQTGQPPERIAALRSGAIQATIADAPFGMIAEREGLHIIADASELGVVYTQAGLVANREWTRTKRDTARKVLQAVVNGNRSFKSDRELGHRTLRKWLQIDEPALVEETYAYFSRTLPSEALPRPEGIQLILDDAAIEQPAARNLRAEDLIDPSLARELR